MVNSKMYILSINGSEEACFTTFDVGSYMQVQELQLAKQLLPQLYKLCNF